MYQSVSIHIDPEDDIRAVTDQPGYVSIQIIPKAGGTTSILFGAAAGPAAGVGVIDKFMAALGELRDSLVVRHLTVAAQTVGTELERRAEKRPAAHHDFAAKPSTFTLDTDDGA